MQGASDQLLGELGLQQPDLLFDPLDPQHRAAWSSSSPSSGPITPHPAPSTPFAPMTASPTSASPGIGEQFNPSSLPWTSTRPFTSSNQYNQFATLASNPYFGFSNPVSQFLPSSSQNLPACQMSDLIAPQFSDLPSNIGGPFNALYPTSLGSVNPSMLQAHPYVFDAASPDLFPTGTPARTGNDSFLASASPPHVSTVVSSPDRSHGAYHDPKTHRAHRRSYSDSLSIVPMSEMVDSTAAPAHSRPFSATSSASSTESMWSAKARKLSDSFVKSSGQLGFDFAQREKEFDILYLETGGNPTKRDRRKLQNRLAQRAFRARTKASGLKNKSRSPSARSRASQ